MNGDKFEVNIDNSLCELLLIIILIIICCHYCSDGKDDKNDCQCEQPALVQPPNYDKESLLKLMEQGECAGGTIHDGKFSIFVCKN